MLNIFKKQDIDIGHIIVELNGPNGILERIVHSGIVKEMFYRHFGLSFIKNLQMEHFLKSPIMVDYKVIRKNIKILKFCLIHRYIYILN